MTTPDPVGSTRDDSPTAPVDLPPLPPPRPAAAGPAPTGPTPWNPPVPGPMPVPGPVPHAAPPSWTAGARPPDRPAVQPGLVAGIVLVVIGVVFLLVRLVDVTLGAASWPLWVIVPGLAMLAGSLAIPPRGGLGLAVPGTIIAIVGGILWVQEISGLYATWAYAWALVAPTGPGVAMVVYGLVRGDRDLAADGFRTALVGIGLFLGFAFFFEGVIGLSGHRIANLDEVMPFVLVGFGALLVVASLLGGGRSASAGRRSPGDVRRG